MFALVLRDLGEHPHWLCLQTWQGEGSSLSSRGLRASWLLPAGLGVQPVLQPLCGSWLLFTRVTCRLREVWSVVRQPNTGAVLELAARETVTLWLLSGQAGRARPLSCLFQPRPACPQTGRARCQQGREPVGVSRDLHSTEQPVLVALFATSAPIPAAPTP